MTIWILAFLVVAAAVLAGWRQGAVRAAFAFVAILFAALLAVPIGHLFRPLLPHLGVHNPVTIWALAPVIGFILASIPIWVGGHMLHLRVDHFYKYHAGELRQALYQRLNTRLGICVGVLNGAAYFVLVSFFIFNAAYWTTQATKDPSDYSDQPLTHRLISSLGAGLQSSGFSRVAAGVGKLSPQFYNLADFSGLVLQNPRVALRLAVYPGYESLWHRSEMQPLVTDANLTNQLAGGTSLGELLQLPSVQGIFDSQDLMALLLSEVTTNLEDLKTYIKTGASAKFGHEIIRGTWGFNAPTTVAWLRQDQPKMPPADLAAVRALWSQAYGPATLQMTVDNQVYVKNWPKFSSHPQNGQQPFDSVNCQGDWSRDGANYTLHLNVDGEDKYFSGTTDGLRLNLKDGRSLLIFDRLN
jgi:hypothetical protein